MRSGNERHAADTWCLGKGFEAAWAHFRPSKPCVSLSTDGTFGDKLRSELRDYETLSRLGIPMPRLLAADVPEERIPKEYIPGPTVAELLRTEPADSLWLEQVRAMCALLYPAGLNIDYYPTNFVPHGGTLYYIDYECNAYMEQWDFEHWGVRYWTRQAE